MDIKEISSFKASTNALKMVSIIIVALSFIMVGFLAYQNSLDRMEYNKSLEEFRSKAFVLNTATGRLLTGEYRRQTPDDRRQIYRGLVREFFECFYQFDGYSLEDNLERGIEHSSFDVSEVIYKTYFSKGKDLTSEMKQEKMSWYIKVDSVIQDVDDPLHGIAYAKHKIVKPYATSLYQLVAEFTLKEIDEVTDKNLYGAIVDKWIILDQQKIYTKAN